MARRLQPSPAAQLARVLDPAGVRGPLRCFRSGIGYGAGCACASANPSAPAAQRSYPTTTFVTGGTGIWGWSASFAIVACLLDNADAAEVQWLSDWDGYWDEPANWSSAPNLPGVGDAVMIDRPDVYCGVLHRIGDTVIRRMQSEEAFALLGGSLTVTVGVSVVNGNFDIDGGAVALIIGA